MRTSSMQRRAALAALLLAGLCAAAGLHAQPAAARAPLTVATYNLRLNTPNDGPNVWARRVEAVKALIRHHRWDLFGTQEGQPEQIADLEALQEYAHVGVGRDDGKDGGEHSAIFYRRSRFALLAHGDFWLSETPERPSKGWDARCCNRLASWARLRDRSSGRTLAVLSVHFDHEGEVARRESAQLLMRWAAAQRPGDRVIVLGDFNALPDNEPIRIMRSGMLRDARELAERPPYGPEATFNDFRFGTRPQWRLDYVFVSPGVRVLEHAVLTDSDGERYPSDHFPVQTRLSLQ